MTPTTLLIFVLLIWLNLRRHQIPHMKNEYLEENATMSWHAPLTVHCFISYITVFLSLPKLQGTSLPKEKKS